MIANETAIHQIMKKKTNAEKKIVVKFTPFDSDKMKFLQFLVIP